MANFDVLSGRLLLDVSDFQRGLQQASAATQIFTRRFGASLQLARRDLEQLNSSQLKLLASASNLSRGSAGSSWSALFAGPAAAFNSPAGATSQAALMGFVLRVNQSLSRQANLADQLTEAVDRVRIAVEERVRPGREVHDKFKELADTIVELSKQAAETIESALDKLADKAAEAHEKIDALGDRIGEFGDKGGEADEKIDKLNDKVKDLGEKGQDAADKLGKVSDQLKETIAGLASLPSVVGMSGGAGLAGGAAGIGPLGLGNGPAAMAGGFAPKGQRGQAPPAGPLLNAADAIADGIIGAVRARNAAGPQMRAPGAEAIRAEVAARDSEKHKKNARDFDDLAKMLVQARSLPDLIAIGRRLLGTTGKGLADAARSYARQGADNRSTQNLAPKQLQPVRQELSNFRQQHQQDLRNLTKGFADNPPADRQTAAARRQALDQLRQHAQFIMKLIRDIATKEGEEREVAIQQFLKSKRLYQDEVDALGNLITGLHEFADTIKVADKQAKELGVDLGIVDKLEEKEAARKQAAMGQKQPQGLAPQPVLAQAGAGGAAAGAGGAAGPGGGAAGGGGPGPLSPGFAAWLLFLANPMGFIAAIMAAIVEAGIGEAIQGTQDLQDLIDKKNASGDSVGAIDLKIQNVKERLQQSMLNLHQLSNDPAAGGGFGGFPGVDNSAYFLTLDIPLAREIKSLQAELDQLQTQRQALTSRGKHQKLAAGGIVSEATHAIIGEAGPEAVLPLTSFTNMLGALPVFAGIQSAMERLGDYFSPENNLLNPNAALSGQYFANLSKIQDVLDYASDRTWNARGVGFMPAGIGMSPAMMAAERQRMTFSSGVDRTPGHTFNVNGIHINASGLDLNDPAAAQRVARQIFQSLDNEARRLGTSMVGNSVLLGGGLAAGNGRAVGYAR